MISPALSTLPVSLTERSRVIRRNGFLRSIMQLKTVAVWIALGFATLVQVAKQHVEVSLLLQVDNLRDCLP